MLASAHHEYPIGGSRLNPTPKGPIQLTQGTRARSTWHANGMAGEHDDLGVKG
jgi:hypothetical protein